MTATCSPALPLPPAPTPSRRSGTTGPRPDPSRRSAAVSAPRRRRTGRVVGTVLGAVTALTGLGAAALFLTGAVTIDPGSVQDEIVRITTDAVGVAPEGVACPSGIAFAAGSSFTCRGNVDGQQVTYWVHQDDGTGGLTITHERLVRFADLERTVAGLVGADVTVSCAPAGRTALVGVPGAPVPCTATAGGAAPVALTVTLDDDGTAAYRAAR